MLMDLNFASKSVCGQASDYRFRGMIHDKKYCIMHHLNPPTSAKLFMTKHQTSWMKEIDMEILKLKLFINCLFINDSHV